MASPSRDGAVNSAASSMLNIQRTAGNKAVSRGVTGTLPVQRTGGQGSYNYRGKEAKYLEDEYGQPVSGKTHENEHPIVYSAAVPSSIGGPRRSNPQVRRIEGGMPGYYEEYKAHKAHIGTGTRKEYGESPYRQDEYRDAQRDALISANNPANAMHMSTVEYANQHRQRDRKSGKTVQLPNTFRDLPPSVPRKQANASYERMLSGFTGGVPYLDDQGEEKRTRPLMPYERAELDAGRRVAQGGALPGPAESSAYMQKYGAHSYDLRSERKHYKLTDPLQDYPDVRSRSKSPRELDTSYYRERSSSGAGESQRDSLRRLAKTPYRPDPGPANPYDSDGYTPGPSPLRRSNSVSGRSHAPSDRSSRSSSYYPPVSTSGRYPPSSSRSRDIDPYASGSGTGGPSRSSLRRSNSVSAPRPSSSQASYASDYEDEPVFSQSSSFRAPSLSRSSSRRDRDRETRYY
ncbi:hypothetical protein ACFV0Z_02965 [Streptomyces xiamenensis]|uniref:hypothetical protein n=1 Tax=Streptomyces xiamenensis TaxID=408015 RepID=UPI0036A9D638